MSLMGEHTGAHRGEAPIWESTEHKTWDPAPNRLLPSTPLLLQGQAGQPSGRRRGWGPAGALPHGGAVEALTHQQCGQGREGCLECLETFLPF